MNEDNSRDEILSELLWLSEIDEIKYTSSYLKKASMETLEKIKKEHRRKELETINMELASLVIGGVSQLTKLVANIDDEGLKKDLRNLGALRTDLKKYLAR